MSGVNDELQSLRRENARLRKLLKLTDAEAAPVRGAQAAWFDRSPGPVDASSSPRSKVCLAGTPARSANSEVR